MIEEKGLIKRRRETERFRLNQANFRVKGRKKFHLAAIYRKKGRRVNGEKIKETIRGSTTKKTRQARRKATSWKYVESPALWKPLFFENHILQVYLGEPPKAKGGDRKVATANIPQVGLV